ncbi:MAG: tetratricopeptide repeat protein [Proteobacteria bacterium]|nr:tetratricopeptide repeat protein [Pseudomonadota bacterium]
MPQYADALLQVAVQASDSGQVAEAAAVLRLIIGRCGPHEADAVALLGQASRRLGDSASAEWLLQQALAIAPEHAWAHAELGETLRLAGRPSDAVPHLQKAFELNPTLSGPPFALAAALTALDQGADALHWARTALAAHPERPEAHGLMGDVLARQGRPTEAIAAYDKALALRPEESRSRYGRGLVRVEQGDMPGAWTDFEARLDVAGDGGFAQPLWRGEKRIKRRSLLLHADMGPSETVQFVRYAPLVAKTGARILLRVQRGLGRICATVSGVDQVVEDGDPLPDFDLHCPLLSLPAIFGTTVRSIPAEIPYIAANDFVRAEWRHVLKPWKRMRVGIAWRGSNGVRSSSVPLVALAPLLRREDVECHALQRMMPADGDEAADTGNLTDHSLALTDANQAAGLIAEMDLIIAVDALEAHLAGALGVPAWVMLAHHASWYWLRDREDSPWYPSMRLFRQPHPGDWDTVVEQVVQNLDAWAVQRS